MDRRNLLKLIPAFMLTWFGWHSKPPEEININNITFATMNEHLRNHKKKHPRFWGNKKCHWDLS